MYSVSSVYESNMESKVAVQYLSSSVLLLHDQYKPVTNQCLVKYSCVCVCPPVLSCLLYSYYLHTLNNTTTATTTIATTAATAASYIL